MREWSRRRRGTREAAKLEFAQLYKEATARTQELVRRRSFCDATERVSRALRSFRGPGRLGRAELAILLDERRNENAYVFQGKVRLVPRASWPPVTEWTEEMFDEHEAHIQRYSPDEWKAWQAAA
jgi:hypothetical protein